MNLPGLTYIPNFVTSTQHDYLLSRIDNSEWLHDLQRRTQHYGYKYDYKTRAIDSSMNLGDLPYWLFGINTRLISKGVFDIEPEQIIVNEYLPGQGITKHIDCEPCFGPIVASLTLNSGTTFDLYKNNEKYSIWLEPCSLVILQNEVRYNCMHGIAGRKSDVVDGVKKLRERRVSLTFRNVIL